MPEDKHVQSLPVGKLVNHPDNPRLQLREDVIERLVAEMKASGFGPEHAILVRPHSGEYQIISGHHRAEAAKRAGLAEVPAWVKDMDDDEAFMQLVLSNAQGELTPLEIGMHARMAKRWSSAEHSLKAYAERVGMTGAYLGQLRNAAEVLSKIDNTKLKFSVIDLGDKAKHLYEISKSPRECWPTLVSELVANGWTVADTADSVKRLAEFVIPDQWAEWLPLGKVIERYLATREFSPRTVARLVAAADQTAEWIDSHAVDPELQHARFREWLIAGSAGPEHRSWQPRAVAEYLQKLIASQFVVEGWHHGNWREHLDTLDDGSVGLLLTDPPYGQGFQSDRRIDRRQPRKHDTIASDGSAEDAEAEVLAALEAFAPKLADNAHVLIFCSWSGEPGMREIVAKAGYTLRGSLIWDKQTRGMGDPETTFAPSHERILHAVKGSPLLYRRAPDLLSHARCDSTRHPTEKPVSLLRELIEATTAEGQLVADPFGGVASVPVAAKDSGRRWWGSELEEKYWQAGEERLS
ncbi:DNA methyltransferase [Nonomuraea sp. CA-218870]|uniref:DNA methyltransferase n=1 Tax=Nonomuraea sp. CA-218870 TaxID=3239998 RepID=UPI003D94620F